ncbi:hypothetical protein PR202_ga25077 [Eleusine coracana subsp. coracana]|uniref:Metallo-hydrolase/oxidoreductase superfamily protein n=1 Tax=Eleusine coracana subsp. coracana TaxID=191504 RepID=A0AAV5D8J9_ELECO|nr:hypothetical protein PR202_ga25077 [Eleusine coracana subsp. coracana]
MLLSGTGTGTDHHPPASASNKSITTAAASSTWTLKLTYLEINSWVWELQQQKKQEATVVHRILVDPILVGDLDFGAPWLFNGAKKDPKVKSLGVDGLFLAPETTPDLLLITQSLDDHCHVRTLKQLSARAPDLPVVTTPNARPVLASLPTPFRRVTYLEPGQSTAAGDGVRILATAGPVLGPPWQRPENGYIILPTTTGSTDNDDDDDDTTKEEEEEKGLLYYEPHCVYDRSFLERRRLRAEVVITPVVKQLLPANFTLVSGQEDAVDLARLLRARYVVPMSNGDVDATGLLATVLTTEGTTHSFKAMLSQVLPQAQVLHATPGVPLQLQLQPQHDN